MSTPSDEGRSADLTYVLEAVEEVNEKQKSVLFEKLLKHFKGDIKGK